MVSGRGSAEWSVGRRDRRPRDGDRGSRHRSVRPGRRRGGARAGAVPIALARAPAGAAGPRLEERDELGRLDQVPDHDRTRDVGHHRGHDRRGRGVGDLALRDDRGRVPSEPPLSGSLGSARRQHGCSGVGVGRGVDAATRPQERIGAGAVELPELRQEEPDLAAVDPEARRRRRPGWPARARPGGRPFAPGVGPGRLAGGAGGSGLRRSIGRRSAIAVAGVSSQSRATFSRLIRSRSSVEATSGWYRLTSALYAASMTSGVACGETSSSRYRSNWGIDPRVTGRQFESTRPQPSARARPARGRAEARALHAGSGLRPGTRARLAGGPGWGCRRLPGFIPIGTSQEVAC